MSLLREVPGILTVEQLDETVAAIASIQLADGNIRRVVSGERVGTLVGGRRE